MPSLNRVKWQCSEWQIIRIFSEYSVSTCQSPFVIFGLQSFCNVLIFFSFFCGIPSSLHPKISSFLYCFARQVTLCHPRTFAMDNKPQKQPPEVFFKIRVLKNLAKFTVKYLWQNILFGKIAGLRLIHAVILSTVNSWRFSSSWSKVKSLIIVFIVSCFKGFCSALTFYLFPDTRLTGHLVNTNLILQIRKKLIGLIFICQHQLGYPLSGNAFNLSSSFVGF